MLTYLASPYSDPSPFVIEGRFVAVCRAAAKLMRQGATIFCPIAHSHPIASHGDLDAVDQEFWKRQDAPLLAACDEMIVLMLPGWEQSRGVKHEIEIMEAEDKNIFYIDPAVLFSDTFEFSPSAEKD